MKAEPLSTECRTFVPLPTSLLARPIARAELEAFLALADGMDRGTVPALALATSIALRTQETRRGRLARQSSGRIALAVAATLRLPDRPPEGQRLAGIASRKVEDVQRAVIPLDDVSLDAYEDLLSTVRPIAADVVLAERLRRSGSLRGCWWIEPDPDEGGEPTVYSAYRPPVGPPS